MKKYLLIITLSITGLSACTNTGETSDTEKNTIETTESIALPHEGSWTRNFEIGADSTQYVYYTIWKDSIKYEMSGIMAMNYTIKMDTFIIADNRWIGILNDQSYVVFAKNITADSITLLKQKAKDRQTALIMPFPSDSATSRFTTWNVYYLNK